MHVGRSCRPGAAGVRRSPAGIPDLRRVRAALHGVGLYAGSSSPARRCGAAAAAPDRLRDRVRAQAAPRLGACCRSAACSAVSACRQALRIARCARPPSRTRRHRRDVAAGPRRRALRAQRQDRRRGRAVADGCVLRSGRGSPQTPRADVEHPGVSVVAPTLQRRAGRHQ